MGGSPVSGFALGRKNGSGFHATQSPRRRYRGAPALLHPVPPGPPNAASSSCSRSRPKAQTSPDRPRPPAAMPAARSASENQRLSPRCLSLFCSTILQQEGGKHLSQATARGGGPEGHGGPGCGCNQKHNRQQMKDFLTRDGELRPLASQTNPSTSAGVQLNLGIVCRVQYFIAKLFRPHSSFSAYLPWWWVLFTQLKPRYLLNSMLEPPHEHCSQRSLAATNLPRTGTATSIPGKERARLIRTKAAAGV